MFQQQEALATKFRSAVITPEIQTGILHAVAEFSMAHSPGKEELQAVKRFVDTFLNLAEVDGPAPRFPAKTLTYRGPITENQQRA